jgi:hypothetical protein
MNEKDKGINKVQKIIIIALTNKVHFNSYNQVTSTNQLIFDAI